MKKKKQFMLDQQEELSSRIGLQGQFIRMFEKEIYDNVNQILCLARIKLSGIDWTDQKYSEQIVGQSDDLIVKAIHDLRNLARQAKQF